MNRSTMKETDKLGDVALRGAVPPMCTPEPDEIVQWTRVETEKLLCCALSDLHFGLLLVGGDNRTARRRGARPARR